MTIPLQPGAVYGPVRSRRLGHSLGINILPVDGKFCYSNCAYCQYGSTKAEFVRETALRPPSEILQEIEQSFEKLAGEKTAVDNVTFSGNGEPTLHPGFPELAAGVRALRDRYFPRARIALFSDASSVAVPAVREALLSLDDVFMKLDAGDPETFRRINRPLHRIPWEDLIAGIKSLEGVKLQSLFVQGRVSNAGGKALENWYRAVADIRPALVHIYTIGRPPADERLHAVSGKRLHEIGKRLLDEFGIAAEVFEP